MRLTFRALSGLRVTGLVLLLGAVAGLGVAYALFVAQQTRYLESRNFRLLQNLGAQTEGALRNEVRVFESQAREFREDTWTHIKDRRYGGAAELPDKLIKMDAPESWFGFAARPDAYFLALTLSDSAKATPRPVTRLALPLASILEPIFRPKVRQSAFDTVLLASEDGEVWLAVGARAEELKAGRLDALVVPPAKGPPRPFAQLVHTSVVELTIGGAEYKLFARPCCRLAGNTKNMLVAGLVDAEAFGGRSRAIPTTIVKLAVLAVLAVLVFWPFLKLMLLGGTQRIRALDVLQIGVSCVAAPGLLTIALLDFYADRRLQQDQDRDLASLAVSIDESFTAEIAAAAQQLSCLEDVTRDHVPRKGAEREQDAIGNALALNIRRIGTSSCDGTLDEAPGLSAAGGGTPPSTRWPHPYFESFSLIGPDGMQRVKLATTRWVSSRISVRDRRYFKDVQSKTLWKDARFCPKDKGCTLESVMSWTTGDAQAVLATTAANPCRGGGEPCKEPDVAVAALSMTLRSLAQPILPPGYEFAVIDDTGTVFFHSDPQRNGYENFFEETDGNRRLRAQILANSTAPLDLRYWGAPYRGYVRPLAPFGLTLVTLLQQEQTWALNREWLVVAVLFFGSYTLLCALVLLITLASNPSWLWPDAARAHRYPFVIALNVGLFLAALACLRLWGGTTLVWCAFLIPLAAWAGTYALLRTRSPEVSDTAVEPVHAHRAALVMLLVVSGVAPALLMFVASFQVHVQTYVKHGQFRIAQALGQRQERLDNQYNRRRGAQRQTLLARVALATDKYRDLYYDFFYETCVRDPSALSGTSRCPPALTNRRSPYAAEPGQAGDDLLALLETYLPYYSESSVEWRELLHSRAGDGSWRSSLDAGGVLTTTLPGSSGQTVTLSSTVPRLVGPSRRERVSPKMIRAGAWLGASTSYLLLAGLGLIVAALARQLVVFVSRQILLTGVTEPLWSRLKVTANAGDNLFVLCDTATRERQVAGAQPLRLGPLARRPHMEAALRQELLRLGRTDRGEALLIDDFDDDVENGALMDRKLTLLERLAADRSRAVVVLSQLSPTALADSVRRSCKTPASTAIAADRWQLLTNAFVITDWRRRAEPGLGVSRATAEGLDNPHPALTLKASLHPAVQALLTAEGRSHPLIGRICERLARSEAVLRGELSEEQLLEEIGEQAASCYRRLWSACSADERVVLVHIAQDGLTHAGARPAVRKLLARKLLRKAPDLRLMNQTFRLFVLSPACCAEVARLEATTDPSVWDNLRIPLGIAVLGAAAFLVATQRELYEALLGATTAAAVSVPAIVRAVSVLAGRRQQHDEKLA